MAVSGRTTTMKRRNIWESMRRASRAPRDEPAKAKHTQVSASFQGINPLLANLKVASTVPMVELILLVAMALCTGRPEIR